MACAGHIVEGDFCKMCGDLLHDEEEIYCGQCEHLLDGEDELAATEDTNWFSIDELLI